MEVNLLTETLLEEIKDLFQDSNINFLIGSGLSSGYLSLLHDIENKITEAENEADSGKRKGLLVTQYKRYFEEVIHKNLKILGLEKPDDEEKTKIDEVKKEYQKFFDRLRKLLFLRKSAILNKQANIFTTNIDVFMESALDYIGCEYNDGFIGKINSTFSSSNFKKIYRQKSLHYDIESEIPSVNLIKLHGSLTWSSSKNKEILFSRDIQQVSIIHKNKETDFYSEYEKLCIVNPAKEKFRDTLLNQNYYDMLRIYSNELEKENTLLFVMGFSFSDEHIREITIRVANSNPTLLVYVFSFDESEGVRLIKEFSGKSVKNKNIRIICRQQAEDIVGVGVKEEVFDFSAINQFLIGGLIRLTNVKDG